jgi:hypothetical protein
MFPARLDVPTLALGILPDPLPCRRFMAVSRLELAGIDHAKAAARLGREGGEEISGLWHQ